MTTIATRFENEFVRAYAHRTILPSGGYQTRQNLRGRENPLHRIQIDQRDQTALVYDVAKDTVLYKLKIRGDTFNQPERPVDFGVYAMMDEPRATNYDRCPTWGVSQANPIGIGCMYYIVDSIHHVDAQTIICLYDGMNYKLLVGDNAPEVFATMLDTEAPDLPLDAYKDLPYTALCDLYKELLEKGKEMERSSKDSAEKAHRSPDEWRMAKTLIGRATGITDALSMKEKVFLDVFNTDGSIKPNLGRRIMYGAEDFGANHIDWFSSDFGQKYNHFMSDITVDDMKNRCTVISEARMAMIAASQEAGRKRRAEEELSRT